MSATCQNCAAKVADAFLCRTCAKTLRQMLADLPWWIDRLAEAAVGQAKLGDGGRHTRSEPEGLVEYADPIAGDERLERAMASGKFGRDRVLAAGRVNARASRLLDSVQNSLTTIVRDLCETRGVRAQIGRTGAQINSDGRESHFGSSGGLAGQTALWLAENVSAVAASEDACQTFAEIKGHITAIEHAVNRPIAPRFLGPCPAPSKGDGRMRCNTMLLARREAIEVTCPNRECRTVHNVERLETQLLNEIEYYRFTRAELLQVLEWRGEPVDRRRMHDWVHDGRLKPSGYRRPDGRFGISRHSDADKPVYRLADARKLRAEIVRKAKAG